MAAEGEKNTRDLDKALLGRHTKILYGCLAHSKAAVLAQMRTGKCKLKSYVSVWHIAIGAEDTKLCECGQKETVKLKDED